MTGVQTCALPIFVVLHNDGRPGNSRTRTDGILSSRLVIFSSYPTSRNERRGRTTFCRPVPSRALGSPPAGPYGGPGRLRTLLDGSFLARLRQPKCRTACRGQQGTAPVMSHGVVLLVRGSNIQTRPSTAKKSLICQHSTGRKIHRL